ncbi:MAG: glycosyltransferase, partial [Peptostreptococcus sp.]|nr:glycosyltransferase [Peptostreptococcus sp.]
AGHLIKRKGYDLLLEAWKKFEQTNKEWQLIIAGEGNIKEELNKYLYPSTLTGN